MSTTMTGLSATGACRHACLPGPAPVASTASGSLMALPSAGISTAASGLIHLPPSCSV